MLNPTYGLWSMGCRRLIGRLIAFVNFRAREPRPYEAIVRSVDGSLSRSLSTRLISYRGGVGRRAERRSAFPTKSSPPVEWLLLGLTAFAHVDRVDLDVLGTDAAEIHADADFAVNALKAIAVSPCHQLAQP